MRISKIRIELPLLLSLIFLPALAVAEETKPSGLKLPRFTGYVKTLNLWTQTSGLAPETPFPERGEDIFDSLERVRLKTRVSKEWTETQKVSAAVTYDHQAHFGSAVGSGDFRLAQRHSEDRQFLDLSQTLVEKNNAVYVHRLYRASGTYENDYFEVEVGRQQIPWGKGYFFTPTDLFNPFIPTQIEIDERDGTDAVNIQTQYWEPAAIQFIYTPRGRRLHPQRFLGRVSHDVKSYNIGWLGGRIQRDHAVGFDWEGNLREAAFRGEFLYREADKEKDFIQFTVNADYNLPHNILALLEYHFNGQGRRDREDYQLDRFIAGDIRQLAKNYMALLLSKDISPIVNISNRFIMNADDVSFYVRPEIRYEFRSDWMLTAGAQLFLGSREDELGRPQNLYLLELKYSF
jgi:hypothetical protein